MKAWKCYLVRISYIEETPAYDPNSPYDMIIGYDGTESDIQYSLMTEEEYDVTVISFAEQAGELCRYQMKVLAEIPIWEASAFLQGMVKTQEVFAQAMDEEKAQGGPKDGEPT